uniref:Uncharacterized protein n=1 Tax=Romanomermis culicivorax TaxID=13658 RepID=A0A915L0D3_ROMCU
MLTKLDDTSEVELANNYPQCIGQSTLTHLPQHEVPESLTAHKVCCNDTNTLIEEKSFVFWSNIRL